MILILSVLLNLEVLCQKFLEPKEYYRLYESGDQEKKEYETLLKDLSNRTTSRDYFIEQSSGKTYKKRNKLHEDILQSTLSKHSSSNKPYIHFLFGSIGSGKNICKRSNFNR